MQLMVTCMVPVSPDTFIINFTLCMDYTGVMWCNVSFVKKLALCNSQLKAVQHKLECMIQLNILLIYCTCVTPMYACMYFHKTSIYMTVRVHMGYTAASHTITQLYRYVAKVLQLLPLYCTVIVCYAFT